MAAVQKAQQLARSARGLLEPAYARARVEVVKGYDELMAKNAQYVVKDKAAADKLLKQWAFTNLARIPPGIQHAKEEAAVFRSRLAAYKDLPTTELATYVAFGAEVYAWFCIGEIVGRGFSLTGYSV